MGNEQRRTSLPDTAAYVPFMVLSGARTGSHMLVFALKTNPEVRCFSEVFNKGVDFVPFGVDGYDNFSGADRTLREEDGVAFLNRRIYCQHPGSVRAVGFKLLYGQAMYYEGVMEELVRRADIRVVHVHRANLLRSLASLKVAEATGVFVEQTGRRPAHVRLRSAIRHPLRAARRLRAMLPRPSHASPSERPRVTISPEELSEFVVRTEMTMSHFDQIFAGHPMLKVSYESMVAHQNDVFSDVQTFLGVEPQPLSVGTRRQNPERLQDIIQNYGELYAAFRDSPHAAMFDAHVE